MAWTMDGDAHKFVALRASRVTHRVGSGLCAKVVCSGRGEPSEVCVCVKTSASGLGKKSRHPENQSRKNQRHAN